MIKVEIKNTKVGDVIKLNRKVVDVFADNYVSADEGKVIAVYPNFVLIQCKYWKQAVDIGTLVMLGLENGYGGLVDMQQEGYSFERKWSKES